MFNLCDRTFNILKRQDIERGKVSARTVYDIITKIFSCKKKKETVVLKKVVVSNYAF